MRARAFITELSVQCLFRCACGRIEDKSCRSDVKRVLNNNLIIIHAHNEHTWSTSPTMKVVEPHRAPGCLSDHRRKHTHWTHDKNYLSRRPACGAAAASCGARRRALRPRLAQHAPLSARDLPLRQRSAPCGGLVVVAAIVAADAKGVVAVAALLEEVGEELARLDSCPPRKGRPRPRKGGNSNSRSGGSLHDSRATRARVGAATRGERGAVERVRAQAARLGRDRHPLGRLLAMRGHQAVQVAVSRGTEVSEGRRRCVQAEVERVRGGSAGSG